MLEWRFLCHLGVVPVGAISAIWSVWFKQQLVQINTNWALMWCTALSDFILPIIILVVLFLFLRRLKGFDEISMQHFEKQGGLSKLSCPRYSQVKITGMRHPGSLVSKLASRVAFQAAFPSHSQLSWTSKLNWQRPRPLNHTFCSTLLSF